MKTTQTKITGAFGATEIGLTPEAKRSLTFDVRNCPHCGGHHASVDSELVPPNKIVLRCPSTGGRPLVLTAKLFIHRL